MGPGPHKLIVARVARLAPARQIAELNAQDTR
jgi:hypothetical protein